MSPRNESELAHDRWNRIVVPTAKGLERFFWHVAWFTVLLALLFGGTCIPAHRPDHRDEPPAFASSR
ncbi:MAG: hypothetical protein DCC68_05135 [Planctomycetota bacterium]|nr:MAG: hypothetical protein DCC68_05135 [Planctomycetota bacterium]